MCKQKEIFKVRILISPKHNFVSVFKGKKYAKLCML